MGRFLSNGTNENDLFRLIHIVKDAKTSHAQFPQGRLKLKRRGCRLQDLAVSGFDQRLMNQLVVNGLGNLAAVKDLDRL
jgi:hypothetical protein